MASLLDLLLGGQGGVLGALPSSNDPAWKAILAQQGLGGPGPAMDASAIGGAAPDIRSMLGGLGRTLMGPGPNVDLGAMGGALPQDQFGAGAQPTSLYGVNPSGFGFQPPAPNPIPPPTNPTGPPVALLENRPTPRVPPAPADPNLPPVSRPAQGRQQAPSGLPQGYDVSGAPTGGGNLGAAFANFAGGGNLIDRLIHSGLGAATGQRTDPLGYSQQMQQATYQALRSAGYPHADAALAATNPEVMKAIVTNAYQQPKFEKAGPGEEAYLVGGGQGRLGPGGGGPSGVSGAGITQLTPGMSVQEKAAQEAAGQKQGQAAAVLPQTLSMADNALRTIDQLKNHPGKGQAIGAFGLVPPIPGTNQGDFVQKLKQAQGQIFVSIFNQLRGGGAISDKEGEKGTEAAANLSRAQSPQAFDQALGDLRNTISKGREVAIRIAKGETEPFATPAPAPATPSTSVGGGWTQVTPNIRVRPK